MRYLLDTHIVIWAMVGSEMLSDRALDILHSSDNTFYLSSASVWVNSRVRYAKTSLAELS